jgi:hypothetical protein
MFRTNTVIVIGAGAGKEFGLPTGEELAIDIAKQLNIVFNERKITAGNQEILQVQSYMLMKKDVTSAF